MSTSSPSLLYTSACSKIQDFPKRLSNQPLEKKELDLRETWGLSIQAAITGTSTDQERHRLVTEIVSARNLGSLGPNGMTADGQIMSGLPFLFECVNFVYSGEAMTLRQHERIHLAAFTAMLVAAGVRADELGFFALSVLRETLETTIDRNRESDRSMSKLLPVAVAWFDFAGHELAVFSGGDGHKPRSGVEISLATVGPLAHKKGVLERGFSTERWQFWRQRLQQLSGIDTKTIKEPVLRCMASMDKWSKDAGVVVE
ncbi:hypothetical protein JMJ35_009747 [Cladonia borealis]|uniref:Uncharacterized protein n=1 Tax=Cladonia borealis TaxID=184061 RepID=A0AA39QRJ7_9LECA|nr:hypothetical protein JMJ35_009747 [Cladonia borealis]